MTAVRNKKRGDEKKGVKNDLDHVSSFNGPLKINSQNIRENTCHLGIKVKPLNVRTFTE